MNLASSRLRQASQRLGARMALALTLALLPLGIMLFLQARQVMTESAARSEAALLGETLRATAREANVIQQAQGFATAIALSLADPALRENPRACLAEMQAMARMQPQYALIGFVPLAGDAACIESADLPPGSQSMPPADPALIARIRATRTPQLLFSRQGLMSGRAVVIVSRPVLDARAELVGHMVISVPHDALQDARPVPSEDTLAPLALLTFNADGEILTASNEAARALLPRSRALRGLTVAEPFAFSDLSRSGGQSTYAVVPLVHDQLYALGTWPGNRLDGLSNQALTAFLFPALMWAVTLVVAFTATDRLVVRHVINLRDSFRNFSSGSRSAGRLDLSEAPLELREMGEAYLAMTETILQDEAELEDAVRHKEVLLREVHHRVKNNLQLIASILNLQIRTAHTPEARRLLRGLQQRVMGLATIHRELYQTTGLTAVRADELLADITRQILRITTAPETGEPGVAPKVTTDFDPVVITPDQAVPLSLLLTEGLTNAVKYASRTQPEIAVAFRRLEDGRVRLELRNTISDDPESRTNEGTGLGKQLLSAFASQLQARIEGGEVPARDPLEGRASYLLTVEFELCPLASAENRHSPAEPA